MELTAGLPSKAAKDEMVVQENALVLPTCVEVLESKTSPKKEQAAIEKEKRERSNAADHQAKEISA